MVNDIECVRSRVAMTEPNSNVMKDNPLNKIPTLVLDDGSALFDSRVICEYLDTLHGKEKLFPINSEERWKALRYQAFGDGALDALVLWRNEMSRPVPYDSMLDAFELKVKTVLAMWEKEASDLMSMPFCIGHISVGSALSYMDFRFPEMDWRKGHPEIAKWHESFSQRSAVIATVPVDE